MERWCSYSHDLRFNVYYLYTQDKNILLDGKHKCNSECSFWGFPTLMIINLDYDHENWYVKYNGNLSERGSLCTLLKSIFDTYNSISIKCV